MNPNMLSGNTFGFGNPFGGGMGSGGFGTQMQQMNDMSQFNMGGQGGMGSGSDPYYRQAVESYFGNPQQFQGGMGGRMSFSDPQNLLGQAPNDPRNNSMYHLFHNPGQGGGAPMPGMGRRGGFRGRMAEESPPAEIPAYDRPDTRNYNMNALYQMMGGF
jgi:hypothetical protein